MERDLIKNFDLTIKSLRRENEVSWISTGDIVALTFIDEEVCKTVYIETEVFEIGAMLAVVTILDKLEKGDCDVRIRSDEEIEICKLLEEKEMLNINCYIDYANGILNITDDEEENWEFVLNCCVIDKVDEDFIHITDIEDGDKLFIRKHDDGLSIEVILKEEDECYCAELSEQLIQANEEIEDLQEVIEKQKQEIEDLKNALAISEYLRKC